MRQIPLLLLLLMLAACSTAVKRPVMGERGITPQLAAQDSDRLQTTVLEWGGVIVESRNLPEHHRVSDPRLSPAEKRSAQSWQEADRPLHRGRQGLSGIRRLQTGRQLTLSGRLQTHTPRQGG